MPFAQNPRRFLVGLLLTLTLCACGSKGSDEFTVITIGQANDPFEEGVRLSLAGQLARAATVEGLVAFDEQGRVIPAIADRWIVTDDGKSYIFRLRDGIWGDGTRITSKAAVTALKKSVRDLRGTSLGLDLDGIEDIRDMAGRVVEIRLRHPMPHFLQILAQPELGLAHGGKGSGPMDRERADNMAILTPITPEKLGLPAVTDWGDRARPVRLASYPGEEAVQRFNRGEADLLLGGRVANFPRASAVGIMRGTIQLDPVIGLFGLQVMNTRGFLSTAANREAIAMAIDRDDLIAPFGLDGWIPSTRIVASGLAGDMGTIGERWSDLPMADRQALAASRVTRWRSAQDKNAPVKLTVWLPAGPGSNILLNRLEKQLGAAGIGVERVGSDKATDLRLVETVARYPHATWFLNRLNCKVSSGACEKKADERVAEAVRTESAAERAALLAEAEAELTVANVFIPFGAPIRWSLVRGDVRGFATNRWGWHPLMPMAVLPK